MKDKILNWLIEHNIVETVLCYLTMLEKKVSARWRACDKKVKIDTVFSFVVLLICLFGLLASDSWLLSIAYFAGTIIMIIGLVDRLITNLPYEPVNKIFNILFPVICICFALYFLIEALYIAAVIIAAFFVYVLVK